MPTPLVGHPQLPGVTARVDSTCGRASLLHREKRFNSQLRWPLNSSVHIKILAAAAEGHFSEVKPLEMAFISIESC